MRRVRLSLFFDVPHSEETSLLPPFVHRAAFVILGSLRPSDATQHQRVVHQFA